MDVAVDHEASVRASTNWSGVSEGNAQTSFSGKELIWRLSMKLPAIFAVAFLIGSAASAAVITNPGPSSSFFTITSFEPVGQSFTAIDSELSSIGFEFVNLNLSQPEVPVTITLLEGEGFGGAVLAVRTINPVANTVSFADFSGSGLTIGDRYTASITTSNSFWAVGGTVDLYSGGRAFLTSSIDGPLEDRDLVFNAEGVTSAVVPEPSSWALLISGFGLVGIALRRRADPQGFRYAIR